MAENEAGEKESSSSTSKGEWVSSREDNWGDPLLFGFDLGIGILLTTAGHHLKEEVIQEYLADNKIRLIKFDWLFEK